MRIHKIICVIIALLMLCGCSSIDSSALNYAERAFCADVEGEVDGIDFTACVQVSAPSENNTRDVRVEFSAPESLRGIVVTEDAAGTNISLGGVAIPNATAGGWLVIAQLLIPRGQVVSIKRTDEDAATATVALDSKQTIVIDLNTGAPLEAAIDGARSARIKVTRFEPVE